MATDKAIAKLKRNFFIRLCGRGANARVRDVFMINLSSDMFHVMKADFRQILSVGKKKLSQNEAFLACSGSRPVIPLCRRTAKSWHQVCFKTIWNTIVP